MAQQSVERRSYKR